MHVQPLGLYSWQVEVHSGHVVNDEDHLAQSGDPLQARSSAAIRSPDHLTGGEDPDIVFEHPGRETFGASVFVTRRGGTVVTCASTSGYEHRYDNRHLWMSLKRIVGSHFANYREAWEANRLISKGMIHPTLSQVVPLAATGTAVRKVHRNSHVGKIGVLCLAPRPGLGVRDHEMRARCLPSIKIFRAGAEQQPRLPTISRPPGRQLSRTVASR